MFSTQQKNLMKNSGATSALCVTDIYLRGYRKVSIVQYQKIRWYSIALKYLSITVLPLLHDFYRIGINWNHTLSTQCR